MKYDFRAAALSSAIYTALIGSLLWQAFFGPVPNDAGILIFISALPTSMLTGFIDYEQSRDAMAAALHQPVNDRFAIALDAGIFWLIGCLQCSVLGIAISRVWRSVRASQV